MTFAVEDIANKFLHRAWMDESSELLSNMKLQKLLYYQQGFHLAYFGTPLFNEDIVAWQYGHVVPEVYDAFKSSVVQESNHRVNLLPLKRRKRKIFSMRCLKCTTSSLQQDW